MENEKWSWNNEKNQQTDDSNQEELVDYPLVRDTRLIADIYQRCNVVVLEPTGYQEAEKDPKWRDAMRKELAMIKKIRPENQLKDLNIRR